MSGSYSSEADFAPIRSWISIPVYNPNPNHPNNQVLNDAHIADVLARKYERV